VLLGSSPYEYRLFRGPRRLPSYSSKSSSDSTRKAPANGKIVFSSNHTTGTGVDNPEGDYEIFRFSATLGEEPEVEVALA
jgi:hypothetical protein